MTGVKTAVHTAMTTKPTQFEKMLRVIGFECGAGLWA
jgi:hypothetical protein